MSRQDGPARRRWAEEQALASLVRAAEAMLVPTPQDKAAALIWAGKAIVLIAESDPEERARELAVGAINHMLAEPQARERG